MNACTLIGLIVQSTLVIRTLVIRTSYETLAIRTSAIRTDSKILSNFSGYKNIHMCCWLYTVNPVNPKSSVERILFGLAGSPDWRGNNINRSLYDEITCLRISGSAALTIASLGLITYATCHSV